LWFMGVDMLKIFMYSEVQGYGQVVFTDPGVERRNGIVEIS